MKPEITIETNRFLLLAITPSYVKKLFETQPQEYIQQQFGIEENGFLRLRDMQLKGMESYRISLFYFLIVDKQTHQTIGECGFHSWNKAHHRAELFYFLKDEIQRGKGFMSEVLPNVIQFGFEQLKLHRIEALVAPNNSASVKLLLKNNFQFEGTKRQDYLVDDVFEDSDCYSLLVNDKK